jgi:23S rRNA (guanosine2251-2'-O)-methyltransferase
MCGSDSHQSFAAHVKGRTYYDVKKLMAEVRDRSHSLILMCDQIFDPQNLGALIRSAECLGADAVGWSKNRGSDLTPAVSKASCGASEWMRLLRVSNLADAADQLQKEGYEIVAAVLAPGSQNVFRHRFAPKTVFIVGSEGEGIQPLLQKKADRLVHIPMEGKIESLNVAQAAVVLMTCYRICFL